MREAPTATSAASTWSSPTPARRHPARHAPRLGATSGPVLDVNVRGAMATLVAAIPVFLAQKHGHLVGVSSLAGCRGLPTSAAYSASKAALSVFLESLRIDLAPAGIRVTDVQPGFVATPINEKATHPMPFRWPVDRAARHIARRLEGAPAVIAFPWPLVFATRFGAPSADVDLRSRRPRVSRPARPEARRAAGAPRRASRPSPAKRARATRRPPRARTRSHVDAASGSALPVRPEPRERRRVALQLRPRALLEGPVVVEVRPVVQPPEERVQVVRREPEASRGPHAARVELVGRVVDRPRRQRLLVGQPQAERVQRARARAAGTSPRPAARRTPSAPGSAAVDRRRVVPAPAAATATPARRSRTTRRRRTRPPARTAATGGVARRTTRAPGDVADAARCRRHEGV